MLLLLNNAQNILSDDAPHRVKDEYACNYKRAPNPMRAFDVEPNESTDHNGVKGQGMKQMPHRCQRSFHASSSRGKIKSIIRQEPGSSQSPLSLELRVITVQAPVG